MRDVAIVGYRMSDLAHAATTLRSLSNSVLVLQAHDVVQRALAIEPLPEGLVIFLTERDSLADVRFLLDRARHVLLISPRSPPSAALAKVGAECGAGICGGDDALAVREALLIALGRSLEEVAF